MAMASRFHARITLRLNSPCVANRGISGPKNGFLSLAPLLLRLSGVPVGVLRAAGPDGDRPLNDGTSSSRSDSRSEFSDPELNEHQQKDNASSPSSSELVSSLPTFQDGITWYCVTLLLLLGLIDISPLPAILQSIPPSFLPPALAAVQIFFFLAPTLSWARDCRFNLPATFGLQSLGSPASLAAALLGGASLWLLLVAAASLRAGVPLDWQWPAAAGDALSPAAAPAPLLDPAVLPDGTGRGASPLLAALLQPPGGAAHSSLAAGLPSALLWVAVLPAAAEELLFRGLLLTALRERLGRIDAVSLCAALFALFHLSPSLFFPNTVLGMAAGLAVVASGSTLPAVALHLSFNAAAVGYAAALAGGAVAPGVVPGVLVLAAAAGGVLAVGLTWKERRRENL